MSISSSNLGMAQAPIAWRRTGLAPLSGLVGGLALIGLYLGILSLLQSPAHALEQLSQDGLWVTLAALGFGTQIGLYVYLRQIIQAMKPWTAGTQGRLAGATAFTGAGTDISTLGMLACCAHHITDIAPLIGLTGASGLSGILTFLGVYKIPIIVFGLLVNLVGTGVSLRTIQKERMHLQIMQRTGNSERASLPACH